LSAADVYSLGKILYFLFRKEVHGGHEEDYGKDPSRSLARLFPSHPQMALVDEVVSRTVRRNPEERITSASHLLNRVQRLTERIEDGGRVLDLGIPQRCLYCAEGYYRPAHADSRLHSQSYPGQPVFPTIDERRKPDDELNAHQSKYATMRNVAGAVLGAPKVGIPLLLICDYCGNVQYFRLNIGQYGRGENWRP
jgi:hypothetical protein